MRPFSARPLFCGLSLLLSFALTLSSAHPLPAGTNSLDDSLRQLADRVAAIPNLRGPLRLEFFQDSAFEAETGKDWRATFQKEIEAHHLTLSEDPSALLLRVGIAETPTQFVFSAAARVADKGEVRFVTLPRTSFHPASLSVAPIRIERQLIFENPDRILDASTNVPEGGLVVLLLRNAVLTVLRFDSAGQPTHTISFTSAGAPPSRDPHAELVLHANDGTLLLPTRSCDFSWSTSTDPKCHPGNPSWRSSTILTPSCDSGSWKLLADGPDYSTPDVLQVIPNGQLRQGSATLLSDFPGPILSIINDQSAASALVIAKNLQTGDYEVYKITLACGN